MWGSQRGSERLNNCSREKESRLKRGTMRQGRVLVADKIEKKIKTNGGLKTVEMRSVGKEENTRRETRRVMVRVRIVF